MQEPHSEGVANHADLESCAGDGDIAGEALDRGTGGPAIEPRNPEFRAPTLWTEGEGHIVGRAIASGGRARRGRWNPRTPENSPRENRETSATRCSYEQAGG